MLDVAHGDGIAVDALARHDQSYRDAAASGALVARRDAEAFLQVISRLAPKRKSTRRPRSRGVAGGIA